MYAISSETACICQFDVSATLCDGDKPATHRQLQFVGHNLCIHGIQLQQRLINTAEYGRDTIVTFQERVDICLKAN